MLLDEGNASATRDKWAGHPYLGLGALLQGQTSISSVATPCLVSLDGVGAAGVSAGRVSTWTGGFQHGQMHSEKPWLFPSVSKLGSTSLQGQMRHPLLQKEFLLTMA